MVHKNSKGMFFDKKEDDTSHEGEKSVFGRSMSQRHNRSKKRKARNSTRK